MKKYACANLTLNTIVVSKKCIGFPFAITNHLGDALFRGVAVCRISDTNPTNPTSWVHGSSLPQKIYEKLQSPRREAFLRHPSVHD